MHLLRSTSTAAIALALSVPAASAQVAVVSPSNANALNLLAPFLQLNATSVGQATLTGNLDQTVSINNNASTARRAQAISDKSLPGSPSGATFSFGTITLANGTKVSLGAADNLAGGLPLQAIQSNPGQPGTIAPIQAVGGYGAVLGSIYQTGIRASVTGTAGPLAATDTLLVSAYRFTGADLGVAKNYFANGAANNPSVTPAGYVPVPAAAPPGYTLPTFNGLPNTTTSVYDNAYGVTNTQAGQDVYGDSRPVQVALSRIQAFDPTALNNLATNPSFPSGHTTYAFTDSTLLAMLNPQLYQSMLARAADYGYSRITLGVHYPLDIIGSRGFATYDLAQAFTNPLYINNATTTSGTALNLPALFNAARAELPAYLSAQCGASVATCATSAANTANDPYVPSAATQATYQQRLTYGLPTLTFAQAPREQAPTGGPDASILLAPIFGGSTTAAQTIAPTGGLLGTLQTSTINQIIVNTETNALAAFYGNALSYWTRIDLYSAAGYFGGTTGTLTMAAADRLNTAVSVSNGSTLYGNGATLSGNVAVNAGGTFGGGSATAAATTTINGTLTQQAGSTHAVTVGNGQVSRTAVNGTATVSGATLAVSGTTAQPFTQAQVLTATGGITGTFGTVTGTNTLAAFASYGANAITLTLDRTDLDFAGAGATVNQARVGAALGKGAGTVTNAATGATLNSLYANAQASTALGQRTLDSLSGEGITGAQNAALEAGHVFTGSITDEQRAWRMGDSGGIAPAAGITVGGTPLPAGTLGYAPASALPFPPTKGPLPQFANARLWHAWGGGFGGENDIDGNAGLGTARQNDTFYGGVIGLDYQAQPNWIIGAAAGGSSSDFTVPGRATSGTVTGGHGAIYSSYALNQGFYIDSSLAFSGFDNDIRRVAGGIGGLGGETERASFGSFEVRVRGEIGKRFIYGATGVTPFAAVEYANLSTDAYNETVPGGGAGALSLHGDSRTTESLPVFAGLRLDGIYSLPGGQVMRPFVQAAYVHEFDTTRNLVNNLVSLPGATFLVEGARPAANGAQTKAGFELTLQPQVTLFANFDGEFSDVQTVYAGRGGLRVNF